MSNAPEGDFASLGLASSLLRAVANQNYTVPTPIQAKAIPEIIAGNDLLGCAQTGTGKTAAFALPILHRLTDKGNPKKGSGRRIRVLVLSPTRELALQISESFNQYGQGTPLKQTVIFGGVSQNKQTRTLRKGVDILTATPGRLLDLMNQGFVDLRDVQILVLDEADRMLDMGFLPDIRKIISHVPDERQTLLFSATMPPHIKQLADSILKDPVQIRIAPEKATTELIQQSVLFVPQQHKVQLLVHFTATNPAARTIVFTRTKHGADAVVQKLGRAGLNAEAIHGNKSQNARQRALDNFKQNKTSILVATDIAARGIDVDNISFVVNFDLPREAETYVHRIGRTGRAGASGKAVSFCDPAERRLLKAIEREIRKPIPVSDDHPEYSQSIRVVASGQKAGAAEKGGQARGFGKKSPSGSAPGTRAGKTNRRFGADRPGARAGGRKRPRPGGSTRFDRQKDRDASANGEGASEGAAQNGPKKRFKRPYKGKKKAAPAVSVS